VKPLIKPTHTPPTEEPTETPVKAATETPLAAPLELQERAYEHPEGYFSLYAPVGWSLDEGSAGSSWVAPDDSGAIYVYVEATGYELAPAEFSQLVAANESNYFATFEGYQVINRSTDEFGATVVEQRLTKQGIPAVVLSYYFSAQDAVFMVDFWASETIAQAYRPVYEQIWSELLVDPQAVSAALIPYTGQMYTFFDDEELFSFDVPYTWSYEREEDDVSVVDTFSAPGEMAFVQSIKYDDGTEVSKSLAGAFALELLRSAYTSGAGDIKITDDTIMPDGSERLIWTSKAGGYSGVSFFETRGTTFLMLTYLADDPVYELYLDTFDTILSTYDIP
jgi:hypothetical protein